jgi:predicted MPP superfamily phosphohydrolase
MKTLRALTAAGMGLAAYALYEPFRPRLTTKDVAVSSDDLALTILHLSDMHIHGGSGWLSEWLSSLPDRLESPPDLVVSTGDMIEDDDGIDLALDSLNQIEATLGRFYVFGSHDYYASQFKPYTRYFDSSRRVRASKPANTARLFQGLNSKGWIPLLNDSYLLQSPRGRIRLSGVDDPYLKRHRTEHIRRSRQDKLAIALVHSPDVVSEWILAGFDLVLAGHTHAGQVRIPGVGAVVTNCSLPAALAGGLHRIGSGWLHVSPGLGTGKFAPIRFGCPPEATLLRLRPDRPTAPRSAVPAPGETHR